MARRSPLVLVATVIAGSLVSGQSQTDPCGGMIANADRSRPVLAYAKRAGGYCDGAVYERNAGTGDLPVIGVTRPGISGQPPLRLAAGARRGIHHRR